MNSVKKNKIRNANLVVIGSGGGGLAAAVSAAERGVTDIVVLEKLDTLGGNSGLDTGPHGIFAVDSPVQKKMNMFGHKDEFFKKAMDYAHWKTNPSIVRAFMEKSGDTISWLEDKGMEFDLLPFYPHPVATRHIPKGKFATSGSTLIGVLADECRKSGVTLLTGTPAKQIITDAKNNITGVEAGKRGKEFIIKTKNVVIATGGFGGNKRLLKKYCPDYCDEMELAESLPHTGDGLLMANAAGASNQGLGTMHLIGPLSNSAVFIQVEGIPKKMPVILVAFATQPHMVWVNKRGERFADETVGKYHFESCNVAVQQPGNITFSLFDTKTVQKMTEMGVTRFVSEEVKNKPLPGLEAELQALSRKAFSADGLGNEIPDSRGPWIKISDSWDEIADWIGADRKVLKATVKDYNEFCDNSYDAQFAKDPEHLIPLKNPPFYALRSHVFFSGTIGGIKINNRMEVLNNEGNSLSGLYAVGVDAGGWEGNCYCPLFPGSTLGFALNSGRIAGENIAIKLKGLNK